MDGAAAELVKPGLVILQTWKVIQSIGSGQFGTVYEVQNKTTKERAAMKVEPKSDKDQVLKMEVAVLKRLQDGQRHACKQFACGRHQEFSYVIMSLVGDSLSKLRKDAEHGRLSYSTSLQLGIQCIEAIEELHTIGFVHRNIKPANFAMGRGETKRTVFMLGFGLARIFKTKDGSIRGVRPHVGFRGTVRYAPVAAHEGRDIGRADDLWSILYMLIEMLLGSLPWRKITEEKEVGKAKRDTTSEELCKGLKCAAELLVITSHLRPLTYAEDPNYALIRKQLQAALVTCGGKLPFDWEK